MYDTCLTGNGRHARVRLMPIVTRPPVSSEFVQARRVQAKSAILACGVALSMPITDQHARQDAAAASAVTR